MKIGFSTESVLKFWNMIKKEMSLDPAVTVWQEAKELVEKMWEDGTKFVVEQT